MSKQLGLFEEGEGISSKAIATLEAIVGKGFDLVDFAGNFDVLVNATGSIKHLKGLVLQLAVRGRLSTAAGDNADPLIAKLQAARSQLAKTGIRIGEASRSISNDEMPYLLPNGWRWIRVRDLGGFLGGGTPAKSNTAFWKGPLPWVSPKDMKRPYIDDAEDHISMEAVEGSAVKLIPTRSILYVVRGMILSHSFPVAVTTRTVTINQDMKSLVLALPEMADFLLRVFQAARMRVLAKVERSSHGTCRLESEVVEQLPIPLPPLAEQKRIVAKVDQLMALCDELEARQTRKRETGTRLTKSALEALTTADGPEELDTAWKRVVDNFDVLISGTEKIASIRTAILALAIEGRLTASANRNHVRGVLPDGWEWRRIDEVGELKLGKMRSPENHKGEHMRQYLRVANVLEARIDVSNLHEMNFTPAEVERYSLRSGDILLNEGQSVEFVGRAAIYRDEAPGACFQKTLVRFRCSPTLLADYALIVFRAYMRTGRFQRAAVQTTNMAHLPLMRLECIEFPLPPRLVQEAIIAQVEHLMKLCDDLEARLRLAEDRASRLAEAAVQQLVA